ALLPPVDSLAFGGLLVDQMGDELDVCTRAAGPAELPQLAGGPMTLEDRLIDAIGLDPPGAVPIDRARDLSEQLAKAQLVIGRHVLARGPALGFAAHGG